MKSPLTWRSPPCSRRFLPGRNICPPAESDSRRTWGTWSASVCPAPSEWTCPGCADYSRHTEGSLRGEQEHKFAQKSVQREKGKSHIHFMQAFIHVNGKIRNICVYNLHHAPAFRSDLKSTISHRMTGQVIFKKKKLISIYYVHYSKMTVALY